ncbi:hypothetical protein [Actinomadura sp. K4S16]|uniref:hypothetical protein n=1 Tax=Actinomadura sp. K4S16 TaxID=1316147 RepID=UPI0011F0879F|nr:hypothetical protein [Actinomadura sp. K4S16]
MHRWDPLNERQLDVLRRIGEGNDLSRPEDVALRTSARALQSRGLVDVSRRDGRWQASITEAGRFYLEHGQHPDHPDRRRDNSTAEEKGPSSRPRARTPRAAAPQDYSGKNRTHPQTLVSEKRYAAATALIERLTSEQRLIIEKPDEETVGQWRRTINYVKRHKLEPPGRWIEKRKEWNGNLVIELLTGDPPNKRVNASDDAPSIPVPSQLRALHPVVARLRDDEHRLVMPRHRRRRCLLILQALATEAERRGHAVHDEPVPEHHRSRPYAYLGKHYPSRYSRRDGAIRIAIEKFSYAVTIAEENPQSSDPEKVERLVVEVTRYRSNGRQCRWADRKRWQVEDILETVLRELEQRAVEDAAREAEEERARTERRRRWELAMAEARRKANEANEATALREQISRWRESQEIGAYCRALEQRIDRETPDTPGVREAREWLSWVCDYAASLDPLRALPSHPEHPELRPEDLKPYLKDWSPYGPEERRAW